MGTMLGAFMAILDIQITNASLSDILGTLNATLTEGSWVSTAYLIAEIIVIPCSGWLASVFSPRRVLLTCVSFFILFSMGCASARSLSAMIVFRGLQGFSGGFLIPMAFATMITMLPPAKRPIGGALFGLTATFAPTIGPTLGGWLTQNFSWQYIFYINVVPGCLLIAAVWYAMPRMPINWPRLYQGDYLGIAAMAVGLGSLEYVLEEGNQDNWFDSQTITLLAVVAAVCLVAFIWRQFAHRQPLINLRLLGRRNFGLSCLINLVIGLGLYGSVYVLPVFLSIIPRYNALQIGEVIMWIGVPQLFISPIMPALMARVDNRLLVGIGLGLFAGSCFMNTVMTGDTGYDQLMLANLLRSCGQPLIFIPLTNLATGTIEAEQAGSASGLFNMIRNLGGSMGIATLSTLLTWREQLHSNRLMEHVSLYGLATQERLDQGAQYLMSQGIDPVSAQVQATSLVDLAIRKQAYIMAFNDCFFFMGAALLASISVTFFLQKVRPGVAGGGGGH